MSPEMPLPGDGSGPDEDRPYAWLDEWLCEYVDGTMDPSLEAVFEQYVEANPELKAHIQRLEETRDLLCECGLPRDPSPDAERDRCGTVDCDRSPPVEVDASSSLADPDPDRSFATTGVVSSIAVALVVGFLVGATMGPAASSLSLSGTAVERAVPEFDAGEQWSPSTEPASPQPFSAPLAPSDSARSPSTLTTIGLP
jgi:anti-sigma factor RsiW